MRGWTLTLRDAGPVLRHNSGGGGCHRDENEGQKSFLRQEKVVVMGACSKMETLTFQ